MFYRRPQGTILKLKSKDPFHWKGLGEVVFEENDARDICIRKINGIFYMYYCQYINFEGTNRSAILLRKSEDLESWGEPIISYVELEHEVRHSKLESPFVVEEDDGYYLFVRNRHLEDSVTTVVLFSENPERFPSGTQTWFAELNFIHAPEIVKFKGAYYVVRVSGAKHAGGKTRKKEGWLEVTELRFE
jgi:predicted GH43/DUF377 family glycosyl hydrolase